MGYLELTPPKDMNVVAYTLGATDKCLVISWEHVGFINQIATSWDNLKTVDADEKDHILTISSFDESLKRVMGICCKDPIAAARWVINGWNGYGATRLHDKADGDVHS